LARKPDGRRSGKLTAFQTWLGRWRGALTQWREIEAGMMTHYNLTATDIFEMSWRQFVVLFKSIFTWNGEGEGPGSTSAAVADMDDEQATRYNRAVYEARGASAEISRGFDWDAALGRPAPDKKTFMTTEELSVEVGRTQT